MAQIRKLEAQHEAKCCADKLYGMITHNAPQLPKYLPQTYQSVQIIGNENGIRLDTIFVWNYVPIEGTTSVMTKSKITAVDNKNRSITNTVIEGDLLAPGYKSLVCTLNVVPNGKGEGCLVKWSVEYEKENEDVPAPTMFMKLLEMTTKELDVQFLKQQA